jgi:transposase-like protein/transposase Tn5 family protein
VLSEWAIAEVGSAKLGDKRLPKRLKIMLSAIGNHPNLSIPAACGGWAETQAAYRFFDNDKVNFDNVLAPHCERTLQRVAEQDVALLVQDTTDVVLTRPEQEVAGVGHLDGPHGARRGLLLHTLHAFTPDGTPLGTAWAQYINRTDEAGEESTAEKKKHRKQIPIEDKESMRWIEGVRQSREVAGKLPGVQCICVNDSEADIYELLSEPRHTETGAELHLLIRGCQNRALKIDPSQEYVHRRLRDEVMSKPVLYEAELKIRGREAKTAVEDRARRQNRETRCAKVEVRAASVTLRPPYRPDRKLPPVAVNVVLVREPNPPPGEPAVEWILVTTLPIETLEQVRLVVEYYCVRWNIEILFRTLKSGCRVEDRRFEHVDRMLPCLAMYLIVAWRTMFVCRMGREFPDADCETIFEPSEWKAVWFAVHRKKPPKKNPRLAEMVHLIASLGGYIERSNSEPGTQTVWIGLQRMYDLAWAWDTFGPEAKVPAS